MERRKFLELAGLGLASSFVSSKLTSGSPVRTSSKAALPSQENAARAYGSGHFGKWISDSFGLPAYQYTCNQVTDPKAISAVDRAWRSPTDHTHQVGNNRLVAAVSNYGYVQVRQDEGSPKFLNDYCPQQDRYGAGIGFLADESIILSTYYPGTAQAFDRIFGMGYLRKRVTGQQYEIDQAIFAPFGDDPVLISQVTITNHSMRVSRPRWIEYWGCHNYQFSYRSLMEAALLSDATEATQLRRNFSDQFAHRFQALSEGKGLLETQSFRGRTPQEEELWQKVQASLKTNPTGFYGGPVPPLAPKAGMDDLHPPSTFLVSLDAPADAFATNAAEFFKGGMERPLGTTRRLNNDPSASGPESALFLERDLTLNSGESRTMHFLYGYLPDGFDLDSLVSKYKQDASSGWARSSLQWKESSLLFRTESEPWVERETAWSSYYLRSGLTYDSFFGEHVLSQGSGVQYIAGIQGAARDPLQHGLPFVFTDPAIVREIIRYTLKEVQPDGSIPYGIVGCGVPMPCRYRPSDSELWLLWVASEYVLATRDKKFLDETVPAYPHRESSPNDLTIRELLARACSRITGNIGVGKHGLMRLSNGDWNDSIVVNRLEPEQVAEITEHGESVLNAAMAGYVLNYYAKMLVFAGGRELAVNDVRVHEARANAEAQCQAVRQQWTGRWFRRAWLGEELGWSGEKQLWLEPQPWALIGGSATPEQVKTLVAALEELMCEPSPIGAPLLNEPDQTMHNEAGVGTNGGVFAAIDGTLVWALALVNGSMAWDEWKKSSLACHAEVYPDLWYGIWSGPDAYHSLLSNSPGHTEPDFPVMNMHSHAWPLYSATKLLGLEFDENGISFRPDLPLSEYEFASPLLGFKQSSEGFSGWYAPAAAGHWNIVLALRGSHLTRLRQITVNGVTKALKSNSDSNFNFNFSFNEREIRFRGESKPNQPLRWKVV
jgi:Glycosyl hydrolase 36 superfamily, catalytic domain